MPALGGPALIAVFAAAAIATWIAGLYLSRATDADSIINTLIYALGVIGLVQIAS